MPAISGATNQTYTPTTDDIGFKLRCEVTATNAFGTASQFSEYIAADEGVGYILTGEAFPGETLTAPTGSTFQWTKDASNISGETSSTYVVRNDDIGASIRCTIDGVASRSRTIWKPQDEDGVVMVLLAGTETYNTTGPDVEATDGQTVVAWRDQTTSGYDFIQNTGGHEPLFDESADNGLPAIDFTGNSDAHFSYDPAGTIRSVFRNKGYGYQICAFKDTAPTGGSSTHYLTWMPANASSNDYFALFSRGEGNNFGCYVRHQHNEASPVILTTANDSDWNVLTGIANWGDGTCELRLNGSNVDSDSLPTSGLSEDLGMNNTVAIGGKGTATPGQTLPGYIGCLIIVTPETEIDEHSLNRLERFAAQMVGNTIATLPPEE